MSDFEDYVQGLQMLGGILALPRSAQYAQQDALRHRQMLEEAGVDPTEAQSMYPDAPLQWLSPGEKPGIGGKILGGVGDVGALLSTIAGKPVGPPRMSMEEVASASKLRKAYKEQQSLDELAKTETDPVGKALLGTGSMDAYGRYKSAQLRNQGPRFGTSNLGTRGTLYYLQQNDPTNPQIPALKKALEDEERLHPPEPPRVPIPEQERQKASAQEEIRKGEATRMGLQPGSPEWNHHVYHTPLPHEASGSKELSPNWFFQKELETQQKRVAANLQDKVDLESVGKNANAAYLEYWYSIHPEKRPPPTPEPPTPKPGAAAGAALGTALGGKPPETPATPSGTTNDPLPPEWKFLDDIQISTPEQVAAAQQLHQALLQGMPLDAAKNWAIAIGQMTTRQALPR